jgi:hypothetical protein
VALVLEVVDPKVTGTEEGALDSDPEVEEDLNLPFLDVAAGLALELLRGPLDPARVPGGFRSMP